MKRLSKDLKLVDLTDAQIVEKIKDTWSQVVDNLDSTDYSAFNDVTMDFIYDNTISVEKFKSLIEQAFNY